jgi:hypothetical protein
MRTSVKEKAKRAVRISGYVFYTLCFLFVLYFIFGAFIITDSERDLCATTAPAACERALTTTELGSSLVFTGTCSCQTTEDDIRVLWRVDSRGHVCRDRITGYFGCSRE